MSVNGFATSVSRTTRSVLPGKARSVQGTSKVFSFMHGSMLKSRSSNSSSDPTAAKECLADKKKKTKKTKKTKSADGGISNNKIHGIDRMHWLGFSGMNERSETRRGTKSRSRSRSSCESSASNRSGHGTHSCGNENNISSRNAYLYRYTISTLSASGRRKILSTLPSHTWVSIISEGQRA